MEMYKQISAYDILRYLYEAEQVKGNINKMSMIMQISHSDEFRKICKYLFDPMITFGISAPDIKSVEPVKSIPTYTFSPLINLMEELSKRTFTGNNAKEKICEVINTYPESWRGWVSRLLNGKFPTGVSDGTILKIYPDLYVQKELQLAESWNPLMVKKYLDEGGVWWNEPKWDGVRFTLCIIDGNYRALSRSFKDFYIGNVEHIIPEVKEFLDEGFAVDMEAVVFKPLPLGGNDFNLASGIMRTKGYHPDRLRVVGAVIDYFPVNMIGEKDIYKVTYLKRREFLHHRLFSFPKESIIPSPSIPSNSYNECLDIRQGFINQGLTSEGSVLKKPEGFYTFTRSFDWIKAKLTLRDDYQIVDYTLGTGKYALPPSPEIQDKLVSLGYKREEAEGLNCAIGALIINVKGNLCNVGTGFDDLTRYELMLRSSKEDLIGKFAELEYHSITPDNALREPVFHLIRIDK